MSRSFHLDTLKTRWGVTYHVQVGRLHFHLAREVGIYGFEDTISRMFRWWWA